MFAIALRILVGLPSIFHVTNAKIFNVCELEQRNSAVMKQAKRGKDRKSGGDPHVSHILVGIFYSIPFHQLNDLIHHNSQRRSRNFLRIRYEYDEMCGNKCVRIQFLAHISAAIFLAQFVNFSYRNCDEIEFFIYHFGEIPYHLLQISTHEHT